MPDRTKYRKYRIEVEMVPPHCCSVCQFCWEYMFCTAVTDCRTIDVDTIWTWPDWCPLRDAETGGDQNGPE